MAREPRAETRGGGGAKGDDDADDADAAVQNAAEDVRMDERAHARNVRAGDETDADVQEDDAAKRAIIIGK
jgi:hypothetical protein